MENPKILVVDDNATNISLLKSQLAFKPYTVISATSGEEALEKIEEEKPDVVILDIMMPDMDGYEVLEEIRENPDTEELPVIMCSALSDIENHVQAKMAGANAYLDKPLVTSLLFEELDRLFK